MDEKGINCEGKKQADVYKQLDELRYSTQANTTLVDKLEKALDAVLFNHVTAENPAPIKNEARKGADCVLGQQIMDMAVEVEKNNLRIENILKDLQI